MRCQMRHVLLSIQQGEKKKKSIIDELDNRSIFFVSHKEFFTSVVVVPGHLSFLSEGQVPKDIQPDVLGHGGKSVDFHC